MKFTGITVDPRQMGGMPCIRGLRVTVWDVLDMLAPRPEGPPSLPASGYVGAFLAIDSGSLPGSATGGALQGGLVTSSLRLEGSYVVLPSADDESAPELMLELSSRQIPTSVPSSR